MCRLALLAPPPSVIFVLTLVVVVLRRHPECQALIHRAPAPVQGGKTAEAGAAAAGADAFDFAAEDPALALKEGAVTSLWEVAALQRHYLPAVATLACGLETSAPEDPKAPSPFGTTAAALDELAAITYAALFAQEAKERKLGAKQKQQQQQQQQKGRGGDRRSKGSGGAAEPEEPGVALVFQPPKRPHALFQPGDCFDGLFALTAAEGVQEEPASSQSSS